MIDNIHNIFNVDYSLVSLVNEKCISKVWNFVRLLLMIRVI